MSSHTHVNMMSRRHVSCAIEFIRCRIDFAVPTRILRWSESSWLGCTLSRNDLRLRRDRCYCTPKPPFLCGLGRMLAVLFQNNHSHLFLRCQHRPLHFGDARKFAEVLAELTADKKNARKQEVCAIAARLQGVKSAKNRTRGSYLDDIQARHIVDIRQAGKDEANSRRGRSWGP